MINLKAIDLFKDGHLKSIPFGTLRESIITKLGEPDWIIDNNESSVIRFDNTEFYFTHLNEGLKKLDGIVIIPLDDNDPPERVNFSCDWFTSDLNYEQTKNHLTSSGINFIETVSETDKNNKVIKTSGNVNFLFYPDDLKICKAGIFIET